MTTQNRTRTYKLIIIQQTGTKNNEYTLVTALEFVHETPVRDE